MERFPILYTSVRYLHCVMICEDIKLPVLDSVDEKQQYLHLFLVSLFGKKLIE